MKKYKFYDRFLFSPIASIILIISLPLYFFTRGWLWAIAAGLSLIYITFKWMDVEAGHKIS